MKSFNYGILCGVISKDLIWIRLGLCGIAIKKTPLLFSERNGYTKYLKLPFGWRLEILKAIR